jgi:hypothetical protein
VQPFGGGLQVFGQVVEADVGEFGEQQFEQAPTFRAWAARRQAQVEGLSLQVGHRDVVGCL